MAKSRKQPEGIQAFEELMRGLGVVPEAELKREIDKYEARKRVKKAKAKKAKPSR